MGDGRLTRSRSLATRRAERAVWAWAAGALGLAALPVVAHWLGGAMVGWDGLPEAFAFVLAMVAGAAWLVGRPRLLVVALAATLAAGAWYGATGATIAAWLALLGYEVALLAAARWAWQRWSGAGRVGRWLGRAALWGATAAAGSAVPVMAMQLESRFSDEEFALLGVAAVLAALVGGAFGLLLPLRPRAAPHGARAWFGALAVAFPLVLGGVGVRGYQRSFFGAVALPYEGIHADAPFRCATLPATEGQRDTGEALFQQFLDGLAANRNAAAPEWGLLALATGEPAWAARFHDALLDDARAGRYTEAANSVKYFQYEAARRAFFYHHARQRFPALFTPDEQETVRGWFAAVNRRAMTVEWVDWLYGLAFAEWQRGPYANQEIGSGLLAALVAFGLDDPALREANLRYLRETRGGWAWRWRNSDDTYEYQRVWLDNAFLQAELQPGAQADAAWERRQRLSAEWLLLQMLPDGRVPSYNNPGGTVAPGPSLLAAARLLDDGRFAWAAARMLAANERQGYAAYAPIGLWEAPSATPAPPREGSCLLYAPAGLPNQDGPLAPDKIVFRDGWGPDSQVLLLNLRFAGWHRYKGTNTVSALALGSALVLDDTPRAPAWGWVPAGRQKFRDKRVPRDATNGLLVARTGFSRVVWALTGQGSRWAQDPPFYATVEQFNTLPGLDHSVTTLPDWRGWRHRRALYFLHDGPIVVVDEAQGSGAPPALVWNPTLPIERRGASLWLGDRARLESSLPLQEAQESLRIQGETGSALNVVTTLLPDGWAEGEYEVTTLRDGGNAVRGFAVEATSAAGTVRLLHNAEPGRVVAHGGLETDGNAVSLREAGSTTTLCFIGGTQVRAPVPDAPAALALVGGPTLDAAQWRWAGGALTVNVAGLGAAGCVAMPGE